MVFGRIEQQVSKVKLAEVLLPVLIAKLERESAPGHVHPPVPDLVYDLARLVNRLSGGGYRLETPVRAPGFGVRSGERVQTAALLTTRGADLADEPSLGCS